MGFTLDKTGINILNVPHKYTPLVIRITEQENLNGLAHCIISVGKRTQALCVTGGGSLILSSYLKNSIFYYLKDVRDIDFKRTQVGFIFFKERNLMILQCL